MNTTEAQHRRYPTYVHSKGDLSLGHGTHVWTDDKGITHAIARLGAVDLTFHHDPAEIREVIAYLAGLAGEMDAEIRRHQPAPEYETECKCGRCGATDVPKADDGSCFNLTHCADRARDAAKASTP